jgi:hypothetical protein
MTKQGENYVYGSKNSNEVTRPCGSFYAVIPLS